MMGNQFQAIALTWVVLEELGSGLALGTILMAASIPRAVFMLAGGVVSDRLSPRKVMLFSNASRCIIVLVLALLIFSHQLEQWHLYLIMVAFGTVGAFYLPSMMSMIPVLIGRDRLETANSLVMGTMQFSSLVGPALAGIVVAAAGTAMAMSIDSATFAVATITLLLMKGIAGTAKKPKSDTEEQGNPLQNLKEGLKYAWQQPAIRGLLPLIMVVNFCFSGPVTVGLAARIHEISGEATSLGVVMTVIGGAGLFGSLLAGALKLKKRGLILLGLIGLLGVSLVVIGWANSIMAIALIAGLMGLASGLINVMMITWLQRISRPDMLGRVMSLDLFASAGLQPLSLALTGWLVDINSTLLFVGAGALTLLVTLVSFGNRQIRGID